MGRICDAIDVLFNGLPAAPEPEPLTPAEIVKGPKETIEKYVPSGDGMVPVFIAKSRSYRASAETYRHFHEYWVRSNSYPHLTPTHRPEPPVKPWWDGMAFWSCAQAFDECGEDAELTNAKAFIADGKAYIVLGLKPHELAPKPKVAKGKRTK